MQSIVLVGGAIIVVIIVLLILFAPSMQKRGHRNPAEREQYEREHRADVERQVERERRKWSPRG